MPSSSSPGTNGVWVGVVVEAVLGVADVAKAVELGAVLGVEAVEPLVAVERGALEDVVLDRAACRRQGVG